MGYHFRNLVFESGGVKGIAYVGALEVLEAKGVLSGVERIGGASAGAITATLVGLGYSVEDIRKILWDLDFKRFLDDTWGVFRDTKRLIDEFGWYRGDFFRRWMGKRIAQKTGQENTTFRDMDHWIRGEDHPFKHRYFIGTNLSTGCGTVRCRALLNDVPASRSTGVAGWRPGIDGPRVQGHRLWPFGPRPRPCAREPLGLRAAW